MPEIDGVRLATAIKEMRPDLPVILISGLMDDEMRLRAHGAGTALRLTKPFTYAVLAEALLRVLRPAGNV